MTPTKVNPKKGKSEKATKKKATKTAFKISEKAYDVAVPKGFDFKIFKSLKKKNFTTEPLYFEHRAAEMVYRQEDFLAKAEESRKYGSTADRRKKKQYIKLQAKMIELKAQLTEQGVDVVALLKANAEAKAETKTK